jgi:xanthine dehydrogenase accessory factor
MLVTSDERAVGSVSGGCVEGAVFELGQQVLTDNTPVLQRYGVSDDDAFAVGLTCGGIIDVFVEKVDPVSFPELDEVAASVAKKEPVAVATVVAHPDPERLGSRMVVWPVVPPPCITARTGSVAVKVWTCSSMPCNRRPGCWCSGRSTSPPRWRE